LVIAAEGYSPAASTAQTIAAERFLLETVLLRPIVVKPAIPQAQRTRSPRATSTPRSSGVTK
jgi:hypothetical protein